MKVFFFSFLFLTFLTLHRKKRPEQTVCMLISNEGNHAAHVSATDASDPGSVKFSHPKRKQEQEKQRPFHQEDKQSQFILSTLKRPYTYSE